MKKTLLALAVSALSVNAFAANVDFTVTKPVVNTIATELALPSSNAVTTVDTLTWDLGFSVTTATQRYIKVSLTNGAKFTATPSLRVLVSPEIVADPAAVPPVAGAAAVYADGVLSQGGAGESFVIMEVTPASNLAPTNDVIVTLAGLTLTGKNEVGVSYQLFETAVDAVNGTNVLVNKAAQPYIKFGTGLAATFKPFNVQRVIDVAANPTSTAFTTGALDVNSATIGAVAIDAVPGLVNYSMAPVALASLVAAGTALEVEGDFSAGLKTAGALIPDAVKLGGDADEATGISASSLTATKATFVINAAVQGNPATPTYVDVVYHVAGGAANTIAPSSYTANYKVVPATNTTTAGVNIGKIGELAKNGASQYVDLALKPGGAYENFVRISNKTNVAGNVYITVIADNGAQQTINLSDIAGQSASLAARSSTTQISVKQIFDAAAAKGLVLAGEGKLRLLVDGEFPATGSTTNANDYGLSVQSYTVAKDGNSFATF